MIIICPVLVHFFVVFFAFSVSFPILSLVVVVVLIKMQFLYVWPEIYHFVFSLWRPQKLFVFMRSNSRQNIIFNENIFIFVWEIFPPENLFMQIICAEEWQELKKTHAKNFWLQRTELK